MKKIFNRQTWVALYSIIFLSFVQAIVYAQDSSGSSGSSQTTSTTTSSNTIFPPWVWVVGGVVLLIIIIAVARGNSGPKAHTDKVTYTKTTTSDDNP